MVLRPESAAHQCLNLYVPEACFHGGRVGRHDARSAPVFLPNAVGGYMPALPGTLEARRPAGPAAAVRWLRHNADLVPGNMARIVSNGTSAGGALSALLGASGSHPGHEDALRAMGAAPARDEIFAVPAFCPITHLSQADGACEWQFEGLREYRNVAVSMLDFQVQRREVRGTLDEAQLALAAAWREAFAADFLDWARAVGRMKAFPAFDGLSLETGENQLCDERTDLRHFTMLSARHSRTPGAGLAPPATVQAMDAFSRLQDPASTVARHWRIRHGTLDRDTSIAVPALLAAAARHRGAAVELALPWGRPHSGDCEIEDLFDWIEAAVAAG